MGSSLASAIPYLCHTTQTGRNRDQNHWLRRKLSSNMTPEQKKTNLKTGLILLSVVAVFFVGFMVKMAFLG